ncbi:hypothetical protein E2C01_002357 [Portunus trituberculatus]|uniref:Uncharacterized protein n=1 Tax=Portunus trituberculatus TaxID=210409 RepID=A0A5B7CKS3_PORTR|nr:hypothetical protein [Portunus trituberculatus]
MRGKEKEYWMVKKEKCLPVLLLYKKKKALKGLTSSSPASTFSLSLSSLPFWNGWTPSVTNRFPGRATPGPGAPRSQRPPKSYSRSISSCPSLPSLPPLLPRAWRGRELAMVERGSVWLGKGTVG